MYEEDAISLGDDEPITHEPFSDDEFDEIDAMVLNRYNTMSMAMDVEASLFRQVPSAHMLTDADMLPLHVRYTLSLYIASSIYNTYVMLLLEKCIYLFVLGFMCCL